ncbi:hypothetical protein BCR33DRAFT_714717 [Rhizoclosmatium globosum]|uniref:Uncharacterized protein n=1 Tax=Rhizoclosmatium globosum TaxID=329046 RepID=A0A1Y2CML0_9FUNG|nr:hypothetical protein BCR33DRAFT_714717 [Rhizoclosmatium globosum]|eukprot:ORY47605.1 hypothetical protein BCR33DRAFT_714717 [Rhizoclosmatium globosum]
MERAGKREQVETVDVMLREHSRKGRIASDETKSKEIKLLARKEIIKPKTTGQ